MVEIEKITDFNLDAPIEEIIVKLNRDPEIGFHFYEELWRDALPYINGISLVSVGVSAIFSAFMISLYFKYPNLRNSYTYILKYLFLLELITCIGKLISFGKFFASDLTLGKIPCMIQSFIINFGQFTSIIWSLFFCFMLSDHFISKVHITKNKTTKAFIVTVLLGLGGTITLLLMNLYEQDDESRLIYCHIACHILDQGKTYFLIYINIFYSVASIAIPFLCLRAFKIMKNYCKELGNAEKKLAQIKSLYKKIATILSATILIGSVSELLFQEVANEYFKIIFSCIICITINLKPIYLFIFCLDEPFKLTIIRILNFNKKEQIKPTE